MESWVYLFSRFTPEALLFEGLIIFFLAAVYSVVWIANRKRLRADSTIPAGVIKEYLGILIADAEYMRAQLFGLLNGPPSISLLQMLGQGATLQPGAAPAHASSDPATSQQLAILEAKMAEQAKATEGLISEKARLQKELEEARAGAAKSASGGGGEDVTKLQSKIAALEARLAEYSVIEDDLANLKRLQQENAALRAQLEAKGGAAAVPAPAPPPVEAPIVAAAAAVDVPDAAFEGLVDEVEKSLKPEAPAGASVAAPEPAAPATPDDILAATDSAPPAPASTSAAPAATMDPSEADLVAEFEKMLNG